MLESLPKEKRKQGRNEGTDVLEIVINSATYRVRKISIDAGSEPGAGTILLFTDVTRDKEYDRLKSDFTSMISHELRTPLTSVRAAVDNFLRGNLGSITQKQEKFLNLIARNVDRQNRLIDDLLDLAKFEAGQMTLKKEKSNLASLVANAVEQYSLAFRDKQVKLSMLEEDTIKNGHAILDGRLMVQAIENLLSNALKFTPEGGNVEVSMRKGKDKGTLQIVVRDTGIGIEKDKIEKIFDKYTQAESGTRRRFSGTGLGLAIVKEVVHAHGGDVTVKSAPSKGAEFTITIPVENQDG
jgi:signal transduction histidine kinase